MTLNDPGAEAIWALLPQARVVGGAVRDRLAARAVTDIDFAVPLHPDEVMRRAAAAGMKMVPTGLAHGTVTLIVGGRPFEVTSLRRDVATDGRHALVDFTDDWRADAARRDFTINAMSLSRDGEIFDYFGGAADLAAGRVRFVGAARQRILEDHLRILRFFRFFARYAAGAPDEEAVAAIRALRERIGLLSAERVWSELKRILAGDETGRAVALMQETGVLPLILPAADPARYRALLARGAPVDPLLRLAALGVGQPDVFARRWRLSAQEQKRLAALVRPNHLRPGVREGELRRALAVTTTQDLLDRTWLAEDGRPGWEELRTRLAAIERPVFPLQGRDLRAAGLPAGPELGEILRRVQGWWLEGGCVAGRQECLARAAQEGREMAR